MAIDLQATYSRWMDSPAENAATVTPNDSQDLTYVSRALYIGGAGNVAAVTLGGQTVTLTGLLSGTLLPIRVKRILSTGTTATNIVSLY